MRTIEKKIYNFDELSQEVKDKLRKKATEEYFDFYCDYELSDDMGIEASNLVNDYFGITSDRLQSYYDLSHSQGSGAMIEFDINIEDLNKKYNLFSAEEIQFIIDKGIVNNIKIRHNNNHYYHEYTFIIDYEYYDAWGYDDIKDEYKITEFNFNSIGDRISALLDSSDKYNTESMFIKDIINMNKEFTKYGYKLLENYCVDEDLLLEHLGNFEYYENGDVYNG